jgi:hypothetical protein
VSDKCSFDQATYEAYCHSEHARRAKNLRRTNACA